MTATFQGVPIKVATGPEVTRSQWAKPRDIAVIFNYLLTHPSGVTNADYKQSIGVDEVTYEVYVDSLAAKYASECNG